MNKNFISDYSEDSIGKYFSEVRKSELLTPEEEVSIATRIQNGDESAIEILTKANLKFVISVAKEYQNQGLPLNDLINEGNYGLIKAAMKFDPERGFRFISYAVWWVKQSIMQSLNTDSRTIRLPANVINNLSKIQKGLEVKINSGMDFELTDEEMAMFNLPKCDSLNRIINEDGSELSEIIPDITSMEEEPEIVDIRVKEELNKMLSVLSDREREIIECYFGVNSEREDGMTLETIGERYDLTKERIRQIKEKAIRKLKHNVGDLFDIMNE